MGAAAICIFFLLAPAVVLWLGKRVGWIGKIGPVLVLYVIGIAVGNVFHPAGMDKVQEILSSAMVPLAIPLMLFGCTFRRSETRSQFLALMTGLVSVVTVVVAGYYIFGRNIPDADKVAGLLTGVYSGGTVNMASLKEMLGVSEETFILLNSYDMVICFLYLTFLMSVGVRLFRRLLPHSCKDCEGEVPEFRSEGDTYRELRTRKGLKDALFLMAVDFGIIGISAGLGLLAGDAFMTVLILSLTTLGIAASFWKAVSTRRSAYDIGMYFIYVFSIVVASMADISKMDISGGLNMLGYLSFVIFASLALQLFFAVILRIDADTTVISSVAFICSPPFVPMVAASMKNRSVLAAGLAIGVVGYAVGTYLGFFIAKIL